ncbi:MAG: sigma 54-interacting transcriptional regulator [Byssovorax sp.]
MDLDQRHDASCDFSAPSLSSPGSSFSFGPSGRPPLPSATEEIALDPPIHGPIWLCLNGVGTSPRRRGIPLAPGEEIVLGSGSEGVERAARIGDPTVSRRHCRVIHTGEAIEVVDLGSRNGLWVGGARLARASLVIGSAFEIGQTAVQIEACGDDDRGVRPLPGLIGSSRSMLRLASDVRRFAALRLPVMVRGESGTGKDLVAKALHQESQRLKKPFVAINAATISRELAESELFGHNRGAFTGAVRDRRGAFREASTGTLFLDEIGSVPLEVQAKLLRVVEEGVVRPLGSEQTVPVDVRLVVATCEPIEARVEERTFRADLYERLAVCVLRVPPLRERMEDLPALARHLLSSSELSSRELSPGAIAALRNHKWPGNVRELRNVVVQAAVRAGGRIQGDHVREVLAERAAPRRRLDPEDARRIYVEMGNNVSAAARRAEVPRSTMRDLLKLASMPALGR